jgi:hypothetical protein
MNGLPLSCAQGTLYGSEQNQGQQRDDHVEAWLRLVIERHDDFLSGFGWQHQVQGPFGLGEWCGRSVHAAPSTTGPGEVEDGPPVTFFTQSVAVKRSLRSLLRLMIRPPTLVALPSAEDQRVPRPNVLVCNPGWLNPCMIVPGPRDPLVSPRAPYTRTAWRRVVAGSSPG